jgi:hypothetical protein
MPRRRKRSRDEANSPQKKGDVGGRLDTQQLLDGLRQSEVVSLLPPSGENSQMSIDVGPTRHNTQQEEALSESEVPQAGQGDDVSTDDEGAPANPQGSQTQKVGVTPTSTSAKVVAPTPSSLQSQPPSAGKGGDSQQQPEGIVLVAPTSKKVGFVSPMNSGPTPPVMTQSQSSFGSTPNSTPMVELPPQSLAAHVELAEHGVDANHRAFAATLLTIARRLLESNL